VAFLSPSYCAAIFIAGPQRQTPAANGPAAKIALCNADGGEMCRIKMPPFIFVVPLQSCHLSLLHSQAAS
jgi:hypothetical protein